MSTPGFLELQLDPLVAFGTSGGLGYTSMVVTNPSRTETRFQQQSRGYWKLNIAFKGKSKKQIATIHRLFQRVQGKTYGWRFRNYREYFTCTDDYTVGTTPALEPITTYSSGTTMQLIHTRSPGTANTEIVLVRKPDMTVPITIYRNGVPFASGGNWTLDTTTGIVTFAVNQVGNTFQWSGYWDTPVRFDVDDSSISWEDYDVFDWQSIPIVEIVV